MPAVTWPLTFEQAEHVVVASAFQYLSHEDEKDEIFRAAKLEMALAATVGVSPLPSEAAVDIFVHELLPAARRFRAGEDELLIAVLTGNEEKAKSAVEPMKDMIRAVWRLHHGPGYRACSACVESGPEWWDWKAARPEPGDLCTLHHEKAA